MARGASCLHMVFQSLGDNPYKQEDLQSLQGLVGQEQHIYPLPAQTSISTLHISALWDLSLTSGPEQNVATERETISQLQEA